MKYILIPLLIVFVIMVVVSLVRGIIAFLNSTKLDLEREEGTGATEMQLRQNKAMFARIKYQALAIAVVAILMALAR
jgi:hypothetical protein